MAEGALVAAIISGIAAGASAAVQADSQRKAANQQKDIAEVNQLREQQNARTALDQANLEAEQRRKETRRILGSSAAQAARQGRRQSGSFLDVQRDSAIAGELDALTELYRGQLASTQHKQSADDFKREAKYQSGAARAAGISGAINVASAFAGAATQYQARQN